MPELDERIEKFRASTEDLLKRVEAYKNSPDPILINEKAILRGLASALLAGASLLAPGWLPKVLTLGGKLLEGMAKKED